LHETPVLEHRASTLEVAFLDHDGVSADAARRLRHVKVEAVDNALLGGVRVESLLLGFQVEFVELYRSEGKWSGALS